MAIETLYLVWNAELSLTSGLAYVADRLRGKYEEECALCELAYDGLTEKRAFKQCKASIGLPFEGIYKNRLDAEQASVAAGDFPCVLAKTDAGLVKLLGRSEVEACGGDLDRFAEELRKAIGASKHDGAAT